jgi:prepilin-type N-terminal cleavage/methylation domain-containing protein
MSAAMSRSLPPRRPPAGLTLVELLIVVVVLGILGRVAIPTFGSPVAQSKEATLLFNLVAVRTTIERYRVEHDQTYPVLFATQLLIPTDKSGLPGSYYPAYLPAGFPRNAICESATVREVVTMPDAPDDSSAWIYAISDGDFRANLSGQAPSGKDWFDL